MRALLLCLLLVGCSPEKGLVKRLAPALSPVVQPAPDLQAFSVDGGQLITVRVKVLNEFGMGETQKCYVWRDASFKTSNISCPAAPASIDLTP